MKSKCNSYKQGGGGAAASALVRLGERLFDFGEYDTRTVPARGCRDRETPASAIRTKQGSHWGR